MCSPSRDACRFSSATSWSWSEEAELKGQSNAAAICGVLNVNKPAGVTSRDVVNQVTRILRKTKVGHAGTLDPLATGVLVVCVGAATRLIEYVQRMPKTYRTVIRLGATSDTLDADGQVVEEENPRVPSLDEVQTAIAGQVGTIQQQPPAFSALKVEGQRAYDLARSGQEVELAPRTVVIERIDLLTYDWPRLELEILCGSGTYIRSIARDVGIALGCGGLVEVLTRTRIGPFAIEQAIDPGTLTRETLPKALHPAVDALSDLSRVRLSADQVAQVRQGRCLAAIDIAGSPPATGEMALIDPDGALVAVAEGRSDRATIHPTRVLVR